MLLEIDDKYFFYSQWLLISLAVLSLGLGLFSIEPKNVLGVKLYEGTVKSTECDFRKTKKLTYINLNIDTQETIGFKKKGKHCDDLDEYVGKELYAYYIRGFVLSVNVEGKEIVKYSNRKLIFNTVIFIFITGPLIFLGISIHYRRKYGRWWGKNK